MNRFLVWILAALFAGNALAASGPATDMVRSTSERMLSALEKRRAEVDRNPKLIYGMVNSILVPRFDFDRITEKAVGTKNWSKASSAQKKELAKGFREVLIRTYAKALLNYSGQKIRYLPEKSGRGGAVIVPTEVRESGGQPIPIEYRVDKKGGSLKVIDVIIDRVSLVSNYRSSFNSQIRKGGIDGLISRLDEMNSEGQE